jgi:hypothetical protein
MPNKRDCRLSVMIPVELHAEIKIRSAQRHISIKKWLLQAIAVKMLNENLSPKEIEKRPDGCWEVVIDHTNVLLARNKNIVKRIIFEHFTRQNTNNLKGFRHCNYTNCVNPAHYEYVSHMDKCRKKRAILEESFDKAKKG